ncbi:MAG: FkbM family methyltransferase [Gemmatimonadota bacterium]|nr:FkbM family methyltransferase [Gemmatimonadota bacterium]
MHVPKIGSFQSNLPYAKNLLDYWLTRFPRLYLFLERHREWQNWDKRVYLSLIRRGDVVLDIGANIGAHTIAFSHLVGEHGRVLAFEPLAANFERLLETISRRCRFSNISTFQVAVGNPRVPNERTLIKVPGGDFSQASLVAHAAGSWDERRDIQDYSCVMTGVDAEMAANPLPRLDFVKIDVEGGELDALKGATRTLARYRPLLYCEVYQMWAVSFGYSAAELFAFVRSLGYSKARVIREGRVHPLDLDAPVPTKLFDISSDVLFFAPEHEARVAPFDKRYHVRVKSRT